MRKFWFAYLAKAVIVFPGGFGTLDELMEVVTLVQTKKMKQADADRAVRRRILERGGQLRRPGAPRHHQREDLDLIYRTDSVDEAFDWVVAQLTEHALGRPGAML